MLEAKTIIDVLRIRAETSPDKVAHYSRLNGNEWVPTTWSQYYIKVQLLATRLRTIGINSGKKVAIMMETSSDWDYVHMAVLMTGGVVVGVDPSDTPNNIDYIFRECNISIIVVRNSMMLSRLNLELLNHLTVITVEKGPEDETHHHYLYNEFENVAKMVHSPDPESVATIIFTSGTTGHPKGIAYTHVQIIYACRAILGRFSDINSSYVIPCWLPLSNLFQRIINYCSIFVGIRTYFINDPHSILLDLKSIRPYIFIGVPRVFEKIYSYLQSEIASKPLWQKRLISWALKQGGRRSICQRNQRPCSIRLRVNFQLADFLVLKRMRSFFGPCLKYVLSGSAPMPLWLLEYFHSMGVLILEAYGISENIIPIAMNNSNDFRFGSVGKPFTENKIEIAQDGELKISGPGLFHGYQTSRHLDDWSTRLAVFNTGDYVSLDDDGFLKIEGRKAEIFKTSTGRKIAPVPVENMLKKVEGVNFAVVFGHGRKSPVSILSLQKTTDMFEYAFIHDLSHRIQSVLVEIPEHQRPFCFLLTDSSFTTENDELTSNLKLKRKNIESRYKNLLEQVYLFYENSREPSDLSFKTIDGITFFARHKAERQL